MNIERFQQILDAYGARVDNWPREERQAAQLLLQSNTECVSLLRRYHSVDDYLDEYVPRVPSALRQKILQRLPGSIIDTIVNWLIPDVRSDFWRPVIAGSLPLVMGVMLGTSTLGDLLDSTAVDDNWEEEIYLLALDDTVNGMEIIDE
ncbi:MAG: hypothetical protein IIB71_05300 [Proteobacteria bacterium]|nr:hypothetical protein [Pseudomonadota bacterium]